VFFVDAFRCGTFVDRRDEPLTGWRCLQSWFERRLGKGRSLKPSWRTAAWPPPRLNAIRYPGVGPAKFLGSARVKSLIRHESGGTMVLTLGLGHRPLAKEILALAGGKAVKCPPRQSSRRMRRSADCGLATSSPLPAGRSHPQTRGAVDLSPTASVRNPRSSSAETRAPIVAASSADPWMSSLLSIATAAKTGQNFWPPLVRARRRIRHEIDLGGTASAIVTGTSLLARAREGRKTCLTGRERKRKDKVRCLV
jgi:hypothetical protein